ncbi:24-hydroxycholesterol 7-alpha-hydroxylase isoform X2 [Callorhinchus milii]|uniref:24-hydroxycholesterol 7-alpha-hydroxylase isoform X2 n=1 Tax=Callorhinchus milii TaxID=7868 RepID=UPI0004575D23|nr:24-hydroxycholesterol 7-alpha-hydroxylase isoform X2 [Callorhinchus milii]|eukprot:gi/632970135/ref/XP_007901478.1/ PREDICTED: 24-hydroxycholesterol 7-alpha-hydroxylase isoform X2 [Callorhinchus milii]
MMKRRLALSNLHLFIGNLSEEFTERLTYLGTEGTDDLCDLVRHSMYSAVVNQLFGRGICITDGNAVREFEDHFKIFDKGFEYGSQLPEFLLKNWSKSKHWLLLLLEGAATKAGKTMPADSDSKTLLQHLLDIVDGKFGPNYVLLMLWASQANALPITFWSLAFIISDPSIYKTVMKELCSVFDSQADKTIKVSETDLRKLPYLKWCILEAIRLRSPGAIARKVVRPLKIKERWKEADLEKHVFLNGFIGFGGGRYQCPGRWFALMEIQLFIALILYKYEFTLLDSVPKQSPLHLVGTQQPMGPCRVRYRSR